MLSNDYSHTKQIFVYIMCVCVLRVYINTHKCMCIFKKHFEFLHLKYFVYNINYINMECLKIYAVCVCIYVYIIKIDSARTYIM